MKTAQHSYRFSLALSRAGVYVLLAVLTVACVVPFWLMIVNATRTNNEILSGVTLIPGDQTLVNLDTLINGRIIPNATGTAERSEGLNVPRGFLNSTFVAGLATFLSGYFSALTAWGFALYSFRGKKLL